MNTRPSERPGHAPKFTCPACGGFRSRVKRGDWVNAGYERIRTCHDCQARFVTTERYVRLVRKYFKSATSRHTAQP